MAKDILKKIYLSSLKFLVPLTTEETYATIVSEAAKLVKTEYGSILLEQNGELNIVYSSNPSLSKIERREKVFLYNTFKTGKPVVLRAGEIKSNIIIPLSYRNKPIGILAILTKKEEELGEEDLNSLILFGSMASLAIRKNQLYDETKNALKTRDLFISMASHELKTPVTTIYGYAQLMLDKKRVGENIKTSWIDALNAECYRLKSLITDLLEISRINAKHSYRDFRERSLREIIRRVLDNFRLSHPDRKIVFNDNLHGGKDTIIGESNRLIEVFINLLDNAAKFSPPENEISFTLKHDRTNLIAIIQDQGKGIARKDTPKIFDRFYKGDGTSHEGLGLGLFLAKNIIERHHGTINLHSRLNHGTTIEVRLPEAKV